MPPACRDANLRVVTCIVLSPHSNSSSLTPHPAPALPSPLARCSCGLGSLPAQLSALTRLSSLDLSVRDFKQKDVGLMACLKGLRALGLEATGSQPALVRGAAFVERPESCAVLSLLLWGGVSPLVGGQVTFQSR